MRTLLSGRRGNRAVGGTAPFSSALARAGVIDGSRRSHTPPGNRDKCPNWTAR
jgi:hypothetical protein